MTDKLIEVSEPFPKLLPHLKVFIEHVNKNITEKGSLRDLFKDFQSCDIIISAFALGFKSSVKHYDCSEEELVLLAHIFTGFEGMGGVLSSIMCDMRDNDYEGAVRDLTALVEQLRETEGFLDKFTDIKNSKPKLSEYKNIDTILKAGYAVVEGRRDWEFLVDSLELVRDSFDKMTSCNELPGDLEIYYDSLDNLMRSCEEQNLETLPASLEAFKNASNIFMEHYKLGGSAAVKGEVKIPMGWNCVMCGMHFDSYVPVCPKCKARIPENNFDEAIECGENELPGSIQNIMYCIEEMLDGNDASEALYENLAQLTAEVDQLKAIYARLPESYFEGGGANTEVLIMSREALESGFEKLDRSIAVLYNLNDKTSNEELSAALSEMVEGIGQTRQLSGIEL